jgi:hypothetical protein
MAQILHEGCRPRQKHLSCHGIPPGASTGQFGSARSLQEKNPVRYKAFTGYGLNDGIWRPHSWALDTREHKVIEIKKQRNVMNKKTSKETSKDQQMAQPANSTHDVEDDLTQGLTFPESKGTKPTKLTKKTLSRLLKAISNGTPISSACVIAGIANSTLNEWRQEHPEVNERIELARERMREKLLARIELAADDDWRAAAELLKLSFASDYRRVVQSGEQKHLHVHGPTVVLSPERQAELREQRRRIIATSVDAQRTLAGTSATRDGEQAQSYRVKRQSLLVETQPQEQPAEQQPEQPEEQPKPEQESDWVGPWHKAADAPKEYNEAADAAEAFFKLR